MLFVACKCLNIRAIINSALEDNNNVFEDAAIGLLSGEIKAFFKDCIGPYTNPDQLTIETKHNILAKYEPCSFGQWKLTKCVVCDQLVFGRQVTTERSETIFNGQLLTSRETLNAMKLDENYSKIYDVVLRRPSVTVGSPNASPLSPSRAEMTLDPRLDPRVKDLVALLNERLRLETEATEERIREFTAQQFDALREFRNAAEREFLILAEKLKVVAPLNYVIPEGNTKLISSPALSGNVMETPPLTPDSGNENSSSPQGVFKSGSSNHSLAMSSKVNQSYGGELQFGDMDEFFPHVAAEDIVSPNDVEDEDGFDDEDTAEEATEHLFIGRCIPRVDHSEIVAKSLPIPTPVVPIRHSREDAQEGSRQNNVDIAASIKALASVHGSDLIFGDLPRPRLGTQI